MSGFSYDRYDSRRRAPAARSRGVFTYWIPLVITVSVATGAVAAWVLRAREEHEHSSSSEDDDDDLSYGQDTDRDTRPSGPPGDSGLEGVEGAGGRDVASASGRDDSTILGQVRSTIRRTPSPQQIYDGAKGRVTAGVAAAGALVGGALSSIREGSEDDFADHERWRQRDARSSELGGKAASSAPQGRLKTVAVVVNSAEHELSADVNDGGWRSEEASLLSHVPALAAPANILVLVFAPRHQSHAAVQGRNQEASSMASSYSAINTPAATTPGDELSHIDPMPETPALSMPSGVGSSFYDTLYQQALRVVQTPAAIMPFSTATGFTHMLKHLSPDVVYIADSLAGSTGKSIEDLRGWVGQVVVVIGGDSAGLVDDTEDEMGADKGHKWWETSQHVGLGKGIEIVDAVRMGDDWQRRVGGRD